MADTLRIRNWGKWQSYRSDRGQPPWIKLHKCVMRNSEWVGMTDAQRGRLVAIWLLAADHDGVIPASKDVIRKLCFMDDEPDIELFIELGFIENGDNVTSDWRQDDANTPTAMVRRQTDRQIEDRQTEGPLARADSVLDSLKSVGLGSAGYLAKEFPAVRPWQIREIMAEAPVGANIGLKVAHFRHRMAAEIKEAERKPPPPPTFNRTGKPFAELAEENPELAAKIPKPKKDASDA